MFFCQLRRGLVWQLEESAIVVVEPLGGVGTRLIKSSVPAPDGANITVWSDGNDGYLTWCQSPQPLFCTAYATSVLLGDVVQVQCPAAFLQQQGQVGNFKL